MTINYETNKGVVRCDVSTRGFESKAKLDQGLKDEWRPHVRITRDCAAQLGAPVDEPVKVPAAVPVATPGARRGPKPKAAQVQ